jgi:hypothetical protein
MGEFHGDKIHFLSNLLKNGTPIMIIMDDDNPQYNDSIMVVSTEKYEFVRQLGLLFPTEWTKNVIHVPNHQPDDSVMSQSTGIIKTHQALLTWFCLKLGYLIHPIWLWQVINPEKIRKPPFHPMLEKRNSYKNGCLRV